MPSLKSNFSLFPNSNRDKEEIDPENDAESTSDASSFPQQLLEFTNQQKEHLANSPYSTALHSQVHVSQNVEHTASEVTVSTPFLHQMQMQSSLVHPHRRVNSESSLMFCAHRLESTVTLTCPESRYSASHYSSFLPNPLRESLRDAMPPLSRIENIWRLVYASELDGFSLKTLYAATKRHPYSHSRCIIAVEDIHGCIFGAFLTELLTPHLNHYGNGECFLWKWQESREGNGNANVTVYKATGENDYYIMSEPEFIGIGCSEGQFGLWLDGTLQVGTTGSVSTFGNEQLCAVESKFKCSAIEVWLI